MKTVYSSFVCIVAFGLFAACSSPKKTSAESGTKALEVWGDTLVFSQSLPTLNVVSKEAQKESAELLCFYKVTNRSLDAKSTRTKGGANSYDLKEASLLNSSTSLTQEELSQSLGKQKMRMNLRGPGILVLDALSAVTKFFDLGIIKDFTQDLGKDNRNETEGIKEASDSVNTLVQAGDVKLEMPLKAIGENQLKSLEEAIDVAEKKVAESDSGKSRQKCAASATIAK